MEMKLKRDKLNADEDGNRQALVLHNANVRIKPLYQSLYHCEEFVRLCGEGCTLAEIAALFGISIKTLEKWAQANPEFMEACELGYTVSRAWWEREGRLNLHNRDFNASLWTLHMINRFGWTRKIEGKSETMEASEQAASDVRTLELSTDFRAEMAKLLVQHSLVGQVQPTAESLP